MGMKHEFNRGKYTHYVELHHSHEEDGFIGYEYWQDDMDDDTYIEGSLIVTDKRITDYDGCYELPKYVLTALIEEGYNIEELGLEYKDDILTNID